MPSSYAGVVGLKPSFGRVAAHMPMLVGAPPHVGPIARSVEDIVLALHALAVPNARDPWSLGHHDFAGAAPIAGLRIAYSTNLGHGALEPDVESWATSPRNQTSAGEHARLASDMKRAGAPRAARWSHFVRVRARRLQTQILVISTMRMHEEDSVCGTRCAELGS